MPYALYIVLCKERLQALLGGAIKFKCFFEVRKHWVNRFWDELKSFCFGSKVVRGTEKGRLLVTAPNLFSFLMP